MIQEVAFRTVTDGAWEDLGSIRWDGRTFTLSPGAHEYLQEVLDRPLILPLEDKVVSSKRTPEEWFHLLHREYTRSYFWASEVREVAP